MILIGNILNIIAPIVQIAASLLKDKLKVLFGVIIASIIWVIAYTLLGVVSAAVLSGAGIIIPVVNYFYDKKNIEKPWYYYTIFFVIIVVLSIIFYTNVISLLPSAASILLLFSTLPKKQLPFRIMLIFMSVIWLLYGVLTRQFGVIIGNAIEIIFLIITIFLYGRKSKKQ